MPSDDLETYEDDHISAAEQHHDFSMLVKDEIERQGTLFNRPVASMHEAYSVLLEEVDEFWDEVRKKPAARVRADVLKELIQIAAYTSRIAVELGYLDRPKK